MTDLNNDIEKYLRGELTAAERHALEQKALNDPFLAEALEGAEHAGAEHFTVDLKIIKKSLHEKTKVRRRFIDINGWQWYSGIAAGLLLLALVTYTVIMMIGQQRPANELAVLEDQVSTDSITSQQEETVNSIEKDTQATSDAEPSVKKLQEQKNLALKQERTEADRRQDQIALNEQSSQKKAIGAGTTTEPSQNLTRKSYSLDTLRSDTEPQAIAEIMETPVLDSHDDRDEELATGKETPLKQDDRKKVMLRGQSSKTVQPSAADLNTKLAAETLIRGKVSEDGEGLPGVNVVIKGTTLGTVTNASGEYMIAVPAGYSTLSFMFIGLVSTEVPVASANNGTLDVEMSPDVTALSEVVVTGYGVSNSDKTYPTFEMATPEIGRRAFKKYLEDNVKYPSEATNQKIEGRVTIQFTVLSNGQLTDFKVIRGIGGGCEEELIRVIKNGPRWTPSKNTGVPIDDQVRIRYKFELP
jgi:TonB family protein